MITHGTIDIIRIGLIHFLPFQLNTGRRYLAATRKQYAKLRSFYISLFVIRIEERILAPDLLTAFWAKVAV